MTRIIYDDAFSPDSVDSLAHGRLAEPLAVVPTGFPAIDSSLWFWGGSKGLPFGEYLIVGGASGIGKTQLGLHLLKQASRAGVTCGMVSLEMKREDILLRLYQSWVPNFERREWQPGSWTEDHADILRLAAAKAREEFAGPVLINDNANGDLEWVSTSLDHLLEQGCRFVVLDHLQLVKVPNLLENVAARAEVVSEHVRRWAFGNDVTVVALSQLKRTASEDYTRTPTIHDLLGGTSLESNPSQILLLDHSRYRKDPQDPAQARTWICHGKNRMGPSRYEVPVLVDHRMLTWREARQDEEWEWPTHERAQR